MKRATDKIKTSSITSSAVLFIMATSRDLPVRVINPQKMVRSHRTRMEGLSRLKRRDPCE
jgi:hypothetical protein